MTDTELEEIRSVLRDVLEKLGANACGRRVQLVEVNSADKTVRGHKFKVPPDALGVHALDAEARSLAAIVRP